MARSQAWDVGRHNAPLSPSLSTSLCWLLFPSRSNLLDALLRLYDSSVVQVEVEADVEADDVDVVTGSKPDGALKERRR